MSIIYTVPQNHCIIIKRFEKPVAVWKSGLHIRIPLLEKVHNVVTFNGWTETQKEGIYVEMTDQVMDTKPRPYVTKDNVNTTVNTLIRWRITDPIKAVFEVDHLHKALIESVLNELRSRVGNMTLEELTSTRVALSQEVQKSVFTTTARWGITVTAVEVQDIVFDQATKEAMLAQKAAEMKSKAAVLEAEGQSKAMMLLANAQRQVQQIQAAADEQYVKTLAESIGAENAAKLLLNRQTLECYARITGNPSSKVFLPAGVSVNVTERS